MQVIDLTEMNWLKQSPASDFVQMQI